MTTQNSSTKTAPPKSNQKPAKPVLGPVKDLEEYVHPDWWRNIFNSLYLKTDADVVDDADITRLEVDIFGELLQLKKDQRILDLCCGQGRHTLELVCRGFSVEGLDRSHYLIQRAKSTAKKEGLQVKFREGDARKISYPSDSYDVVMLLGNSFGYFETTKDDLRVLKEVRRVLKPWGKLLVDVTDGAYLRENYQPRSWEWISKKYFVNRERSLSADKHRLISREVITDVNKGVIADQFYAERLYTRDELTKLMEEAGFSDIAIHTELTPNSQRNQDLGMMEKRLVISGVVRKEWAPVRQKPKETTRNVTVIFGDPRQKDPLKPQAVFDDDDLYTIDQLKSALKSLPDYSATYLDNHQTLISDLEKLRGKTDVILNLCDEGYNNDPRKELHVPAILEMLNFPYTGAAPQCLAYCYDKSLVRGIAKEMDIPVPEAFFIEPHDFTFDLPFPFPVIVKPNFGDSSFGITQNSVCYNSEQLITAIGEIREKFGYEKPVLVEQFLTGKDLSVGIIGNPPAAYKVLPIVEEDYSEIPDDLPKICGYEAKWLPDSPYWNLKSIPANLPETTEKRLVEWCVKLFERLECRDYARLDWRLDSDGVPRLLEVNPNPGWCWDGHLAKMGKFGELSYADLLQEILKVAEARIESQSLEKTQAV